MFVSKLFVLSLHSGGFGVGGLVGGFGSGFSRAPLSGGCNGLTSTNSLTQTLSAWVAELKADWEKELDALTYMGAKATDGGMKPRAMLRAVEESLPEDAMVATARTRLNFRLND